MAERIPFNASSPVGKEATYVADVVASGRLSYSGPYAEAAERILSKLHKGATALLTASCTDALEMSALLSDIGPGDEVIMPSYTFVSTANAFCLRGAIPRFVDVEPSTLNIDPAQIEPAITDRTRAIVVVHYAGMACDMTAILDIAHRHGLMVIEDSAQALGSTTLGQQVGCDGQMSCISFHETKNVACGEGGALILNDPQLVDRARVLRDKGTNRHAFSVGRVDKYSWVDLGSSFGLGELAAAYLVGQLEHLDEITMRRRAIWCDYHDRLAPLEEAGHLALPVRDHVQTHNAHIFYLVVDSEETRSRLIRHLDADGVQAIFHYVPLHTSSMGLKVAKGQGALPVTEDLSRRLLRLPLHLNLTRGNIDRIGRSVAAFYGMNS